MKPVKLDGTDRKILEILQANSNITNAQLAKEIGLSPAPTLERVNKLETSGVIKSYHAVIDPGSVGIGVSTFVMATLKGHNKENIEKFIKAIKGIDEVVECHHITGEFSLLLKIRVRDMEALQQLLIHRINALEGVRQTRTVIVLSTSKEESFVPTGAEEKTP